MLSIHDQQAVADWSRRERIDPHRLHRLRAAFYRKQLPAASAVEELPPAVQSAFQAAVDFHPLNLESRHDSTVDGASKMIFATRDGRRLESVILRIATGRTTMCVSSQVGCAANCSFCATGQMGFGRNLSAPEILDQVIQCNQLLKAEGRRIRNLVFMGMGEPFHNETEVYAALEVLLSGEGFDLAEQRLLVSTVGIPEAMVRFARRFKSVGVALSLHSARQEVREQIIPLARRHPLPALRAAIEEVTAQQGRPVMIEYIVWRGLNDGPEDLQALLEFLSEVPVHINLIPFNPIAEAGDLRPAERPELLAMAAQLRAAGLKVTVRYSLGADIAAACGQLVKARSPH